MCREPGKRDVGRGKGEAGSRTQRGLVCWEGFVVKTKPPNMLFNILFDSLLTSRTTVARDTGTSVRVRYEKMMCGRAASLHGESGSQAN